MPASALAHHALARAAEARGDWKTAEGELQKALDLDGNLAEAREELAELLQAEGRVDEALATLAEAYDRSGDGKIAERLVRLQMATGHADDAQGAGRAARRRRRRPRSQAVDRLALARRAPAGARARPRRRGLKVSDTPGAHLLMGRALEQLGQPDEAMAQLAKVPPRATQFVAAQSMIGRLLRDRGRYREAVELLGQRHRLGGRRRAGRRAPTRSRTRWRRCTSAPAIARRRSRLLEQALARRPQSPELAFALAIGLSARRTVGARRRHGARDASCKRDADNVQALNFIGYALAHRGVRLDEARRLLERALAL